MSRLSHEPRITYPLSSGAVSKVRLDYFGQDYSLRLLTVYLKADILPEEIELIARIITMNNGSVQFKSVKPGSSIKIENFDFDTPTIWGKPTFSPEDVSFVSFILNGQLKAVTYSKLPA